MKKNNRNKYGRFTKTKRISLRCTVCNKSFKVIQSRGETAKFCSQQCNILYHSGKNHHQYGIAVKETTKKKISKTLFGRYTGEKSPGWKGGKKKHTEGYVLIYAPLHPHNIKKYCFEHRLMVEKTIGRYLSKQETIHHINGIKDDNRIENLYLFSTNGNHTSYHMNLKNNNNNIKPITKSNLF